MGAFYDPADGEGPEEGSQAPAGRRRFLLPPIFAALAPETLDVACASCGSTVRQVRHGELGLIRLDLVEAKAGPRVGLPVTYRHGCDVAQSRDADRGPTRRQEPDHANPPTSVRSDDRGRRPRLPFDRL